MFLDGAHHHGFDHLTAFDVAAGDGVLDGRHDDVADTGVAPTRSAQHANAQNLFGAGVVGDLDPRFLLNHQNSLALSTANLFGQAESTSRARSSSLQGTQG